MRRRSIFVLVCLICGALATVAQGRFSSEAVLLLTLETAAHEDAAETVLFSPGAESCDQRLGFSPEDTESVQITSFLHSVELLALQDEQVQTFRLRGSCSRLQEIFLQIEASSSTSIQPFVILQSPLAEGQFELQAKAFFPTAGDRLRLLGWEARDVSASNTLPRAEAVGGKWLTVDSDAWTQYWQVFDEASRQVHNFASPENCHTLQQVFFLPESEQPCVAKEQAAFRVTPFLPWYGWRDPLQARRLQESHSGQSGNDP